MPTLLKKLSTNSNKVLWEIIVKKIILFIVYTFKLFLYYKIITIKIFCFGGVDRKHIILILKKVLKLNTLL